MKIWVRESCFTYYFLQFISSHKYILFRIFPTVYYLQSSLSKPWEKAMAHNQWSFREIFFFSDLTSGGQRTLCPTHLEAIYRSKYDRSNILMWFYIGKDGAFPSTWAALGTVRMAYHSGTSLPSFSFGFFLELFAFYVQTANIRDEVGKSSTCKEITLHLFKCYNSQIIFTLTFEFHNSGVS